MGVRLHDGTENVCVIQDLPILPPGDYSLRYSAGPDNNGGSVLAQSDYEVFIKDKDGTTRLFDTGATTFANDAVITVTPTFNTVITNEGFTLFICGLGS